METEAEYIRLHEPGTSTFTSVLDEAQLTLKLPETRILNQSIILAGTAWKNRMIDMYTNVGGLEFTRIGPLSLTAGFYLGSATREDAWSRFVGVQLGAGASIGPFEVAAAHMNGKMTDGHYRRTAIGAATNIHDSKSLAISLTFDIESRYFNFGNGGPASDPQDEFIYVSGIEIR